MQSPLLQNSTRERLGESQTLKKIERNKAFLVLNKQLQGKTYLVAEKVTLAVRLDPNCICWSLVLNVFVKTVPNVNKWWGRQKILSLFFSSMDLGKCKKRMIALLFM